MSSFIISFEFGPNLLLVDTKVTLHVNAILPREERNTHPESWSVSFFFFVNKWCLASICIPLQRKRLTPLSRFSFYFLNLDVCFVSTTCYFWPWWLIRADDVILWQDAEAWSRICLPKSPTHLNDAFLSTVPYGTLSRSASRWQQEAIKQRVLRWLCPSPYFLAYHSIIIGLPTDPGTHTQTHTHTHTHIHVCIYIHRETDLETDSERDRERELYSTNEADEDPPFIKLVPTLLPFCPQTSSPTFSQGKRTEDEADHSRLGKNQGL